VILVNIVGFDDRNQLVQFLQAVADDRASIAEILMDAPETSITFVFVGTGFVRPFPPRIRELLEQRSQPLAPTGGLQILLEVCLPGARAEVVRIFPEFRAALMAGRLPASRHIDIVWQSLRGAHGPAMQEQCLLS
jgi:hypothetical protein